MMMNFTKVRTCGLDIIECEHCRKCGDGGEGDVVVYRFRVCNLRRRGEVATLGKGEWLQVATL